MCQYVLYCGLGCNNVSPRDGFNIRNLPGGKVVIAPLSYLSKITALRALKINITNHGRRRQEDYSFLAHFFYEHTSLRLVNILSFIARLISLSYANLFANLLIRQLWFIQRRRKRSSAFPKMTQFVSIWRNSSDFTYVKLHHWSGKILERC